MTNLAIERAEQERWHLLPSHARLKVFDALVANEFLPAAAVRRKQEAAARALLGFSARAVPFYQNLFAERGWDPQTPPLPWSGIDFPLLTRRAVQENALALTATQLLARDHPVRERETSGTTGEPVRIKHNRLSRRFFRMLKQREYRWFRFDPSGRLGTLRPPQDLPRARGGELLPDNTVVGLKRWWIVGVNFNTGTAVGFHTSNSVDAKIAWLKRYRPDYLVAPSADLEHLALALRSEGPSLGLRGIEAISQQLTPEMRATIEKAFGVPVNENYGLNEFGLVATRCPEGGRFHVHPEFTVVEILDEVGNRCPPKVRGRIVVSTLVNRAMPLFRYDTDDWAEWPADPCPCNRTSPAFVGLIGRYRRTANLPAGTWKQWSALQRCLSALPPSVASPLRQYQLHQDRAGRFELKIVTIGALAEELANRIRSAWDAAGLPRPPPLEIVSVGQIPRPPGGKFQNFVSDWAPPLDGSLDGGFTERQ